MNWINQVVRWILGAVFVFSGLVKINDPLGTAIKLEEYFEVFATDFTSIFHYFVPLSVPFSLLFCASEIILGVALLINFRQRIVLLLTLVLITFFTFLTFYSAYFNKVTDCGCFGDFIKLQPWTSFSKDIILLALTVFLFAQFRNLENDKNPLKSGVLMFVSVLTTGIGLYALLFLPVFDFLPYQIGKNIPEQMKPAVPCQTLYTMEKDGKTVELDQYPTDTTYRYISARIANESDCKPKITDYYVSNGDEDFTNESFMGAKFIIVIQKLDKPRTELYKELNETLKKLEKEMPDVKPVVFTAEDRATFETFRHENQLAVPFYFADGSVLKAVVRSNPGFLLLKNGTVKGKWHHNLMPSVDEIKKALE